LPNGLRHIGMIVSGTDLCATTMSSFYSSKLVLRAKHQDDAYCCWVCHGRFHGILPKEYYGTFYELI